MERLKNHIFKYLANLHFSKLKTSFNTFFISHVLLIFTFTSLLISCENNNNHIEKIEGKNLNIKGVDNKNNKLNEIIKPYREKIQYLEDTIGYCNLTLTKKDGKLNSSLGNLIADIMIYESNKVFKEKYLKDIDFCLLNFGGIRSNLNQGPITKSNLFSIMPFENKAVVAKINGNKVLELINFLNQENIAHPVSGIKLKFDKNKIDNVLIGEKKFNSKNNYYVLTSDFLIEGNDNMFFFKNPIQKFDLEIGIREILIDYISKKDTIVSGIDDRIVRF